MTLLTATRIRELARRYGVEPSKALGQNFVIDPNTIRRVVRLAGIHPHDKVVEVGAGIGALTVGLAEVASKVIAIELDRGVLPALSEVTAGLPGVEIVHGDAMTLDFETLTEGLPHRFVANLPYNIATPLMARLLEEAPSIVSFVVMVQREAGERLIAGPGSKVYGAISVRVRYHCDSRILGQVPRSVFWPQPKVDSVLVELTRRPPQVDVGSRELMRVVRAAFAERRKTIRNSVSSAMGIDAERVETALASAGIDPQARAESLRIEDFAALTKVLG